MKAEKLYDSVFSYQIALVGTSSRSDDAHCAGKSRPILIQREKTKMPTEIEEPLDVGEEVPEEGLAALEKKYREQMRQIVSQKIELPISTLPDMIK